MNCPECTSSNIGDYSNCAGKGINWKGDTMYWCKECGYDFTSATTKFIPRPPALEKRKQASKRIIHSQGRFYVNGRGEKVYY